MAIQSTSINDLVAKTSTLQIVSGGIVENILYTNSNRSLTFSTQPPFILSPQDFLSFTAILDGFNTNINTVFNPSLTNFPTFAIAKTSDTNDGISTLTFDFRKTTHPVYLITATYPLGNVSFAIRNTSSILTYEEWVYYRANSAHYEEEVKKNYLGFNNGNQ